MLTLTDDAVTAISAMIAKPELPPRSGLRIAPREDDPESFFLILTSDPAPDDHVIDENGARIFLEPRAAKALADKSLHVRADGGGAIAFTLT
ncbi:Fe-S cluster assembly protein HesB [Actinomadura soli]|uniref:Fe-S cluster assembly protein HesB n=1 Tax=Actinomadura soli TaxID=2508997 RepID=A0A5C4J4Z6_9ACTN|nr:Fe-S cluster assembly protein HesB [Actinomadura soli]TMQ92006.1 Fe-S cluster assembly protein HesB [Actinomadura soli]